MQKIELLIIDPQVDFCEPHGALYVPGAENDMDRLATMIRRLKDKIYDIHVTLDSHHRVDIAHPIFWLDSSGNHPAPFTIITLDDINKGSFRTTNPAFMDRAGEYVASLAKNGRYPLCIWPEHCLIGSDGAKVINDSAPLYDALLEWENDFAMVDYVTKGSNFWTEHYSAVQADVPDPEDSGTQLNWSLVNTLEKADIIPMAGEASTHCKINTVLDIANNFGEDNIKKMVWLEDATSPVPDPPGTTMFSDFLAASLKDLVNRGMQISNTVDFLK
jgi:nicotinamidase/pyrazinamidase